MRTGPETRPPLYRSEPTSCQGVQRLCEMCGQPFTPTQDNHRFHREECRIEWHNKRSGNQRSAERHLRRHLENFSRRGFLRCISFTAMALAEPLLAITGSARREAIARTLHELNDAMVRVGPVNPAIRDWMRSRAQSVLAVLGPEPTSPWEQIASASAWEILRDVGVEAPLNAENVAEWLQASAQAQWFFLQRGIVAEGARRENLARMMTCHGNIFRCLETQPPILMGTSESRRRARSLLTAAENEVDSLDHDTPSVAQLAHQIEFRKAAPGRNIGSRVIEAKIRRLGQLARQADDARVWVEHYRELAGLTSYHLRDRSRAKEHLGEMRYWREKLSNFTEYADPTLLTPEIAMLKEARQSGAAEQAVHLAKTKFMPFYLAHPHIYYGEKIRDWLGEEIVLPNRYASAFIAFFDRLDPIAY